MRGLALNPCAMILNTTVQTTVVVIVLPPGKFLFNTITAKTMLANPLGPNHPMNSFSFFRRFDFVSARKTGSIRMTVRLSKE